MTSRKPLGPVRVFRAETDLVNWFEVWGFPALLWLVFLATVVRTLLGQTPTGTATFGLVLIGLVVIPLSQGCWAREIRIGGEGPIQILRTWDRIEVAPADVVRLEGLGLFRFYYQLHIKGRFVYLPTHFERIDELAEALREANPWIEVEGRLDP